MEVDSALYSPHVQGRLSDAPARLANCRVLICAQLEAVFPKLFVGPCIQNRSDLSKGWRLDLFLSRLATSFI
jgi:hypothetical protein